MELIFIALVVIVAMMYFMVKPKEKQPKEKQPKEKSSKKEPVVIDATKFAEKIKDWTQLLKGRLSLLKENFALFKIKDVFTKKPTPKSKSYNPFSKPASNPFSNNPNDWYKSNYTSPPSGTTSLYQQSGSSQSSSINDNFDEILQLLKKLKQDYVNAPYKDKFNNYFGYKDAMYRINWIYKMDNGHTIVLKSNDIINFSFIYNNNTHTQTLKFGTMYANSVIDVLKKIHREAKTRPSKYNNNTYNSNTTKPNNSSNVSKVRKLQMVYNLRKSQLDDMPPNDSSRYSLENELEVVRKKLIELKNKI